MSNDDVGVAKSWVAVKSWVNGPADGNLETWLMVNSDKYNLKLMILNKETSGWIFKEVMIYYKVEGTRENINEFRKAVQRLCQSINGGK